MNNPLKSALLIGLCTLTVAVTGQINPNKPKPKQAQSSEGAPKTVKPRQIGTRETSEALATLEASMVRVEGGTFSMGCRSDQVNDCFVTDIPVHQVTLSTYYLCKYEVTQALWKAVMGDEPSYYLGCPKCPVERVTWEDARAFCGTLSEKTGKQYRLPTEAEWEYAARGGNQSKNYKYSGGNYAKNVAWYPENCESKTHPVGMLAANELGFYDMTGNVDEVCSDWFGENYYVNSPSINPKGPTGNSYGLVVTRGGAFSVLMPVSSRRGALRDQRDLQGFRLARNP